MLFRSAVRKGHQTGDIVNVVYGSADIALIEWFKFPRNQRVQEDGHIVWCPTEEVNHHCAEDEPDGPAATGVGCGSEETPKNSNVAESDNDEGDEEKKVLLVKANQLPVKVFIITV